MKFSENGFWIKQDGDQYTVGFGSKNRDDAGQISFVSLPMIETLAEGDTLLDIEASKAVTELVTPIEGKVVTWHKELEDQPELLNSTRLEDNWIVILNDVDANSFETLLEEDPYTPEATTETE